MSARANSEERRAPGVLGELRDLPGSRSFVLWFGVLGPPLAWAVQLLLGDGLFELGCGPGFVTREVYGLPFRFWDFLMTGLLLTVDVAAGVLAYRAHRQLQRVDLPSPTVLGRARGMALAGVASSFVYGLLLAFGLLPPFFLQTCSRSI